MAIDIIIVQAGGKGTRLGYMTKNKPKALVPVGNLPLIFHLFRKYPDKRYIIISDYKKEVLREYLECFAEVKYQVVDADGSGTCAGIRRAIKLLNDNVPFALIWSDLILPENFQFPDEREDYIGISQTFPCRWSYIDGKFIEERSIEHGVAGFFAFTDKSKLSQVPDNGELVRWMQGKGMVLREVGLAGTKEFGVLEEYEKLETERCRPFNRITMEGDVVIKEGIDEQGRQLARKECRWYEVVNECVGQGSAILPHIYGTNPLKMERIRGENIYKYDTLLFDDKQHILGAIIGVLKKLHNSRHIPADSFSVKEAYYYKTIKRLNRIRGLVPFADRPVLRINGKNCRNVFYNKREFEAAIDGIDCNDFCLIHGDCTFSNMLLKDDKAPVLIDPRGYFGYTEIYGDALYDWAKLYYSIIGNYDRFNLKEFTLDITEKEILLEIQSNHWEDMEKDFFCLTGAPERDIKLVHAIIWLSLTTYAWQDFDSICGAFYNGLYYLEDVL